MAITVLGFTITAAMAQAAITIASIAYQTNQARKMRKAAKEAAEARKGFELVVEGEITSLPIVYGRALIGGVRVYHNASSSFRYTTPNSDLSFSTGGNATNNGTYTYTYQNEDGSTTNQVVPYNGTPDGRLSQNMNGSKNEFLFFQQALCQGPIQAVHDVIINDSQFLDDPSLGESYTRTVYKGGSFVANANRAAMRLDFFYNGGVDNLMSLNFNERSTAAFNNCAYLSAFVRLDRDNPQFTGVPVVQALIEGRKVKTIVRSGTTPNFTYALSANAIYSTNPSYCLLDYLMDPVSGKNLALNQIDLASFYNAAEVCNTIVQSNVGVGGKLYQNTTGSRNISTVNLPLYECNLIVDVTKPIRANVESILATMGDARLIWSQGQYKLILQYPTSNANIQLAATLTDDDIIHDNSVDISWPSSSDRLNNCTIKFNNESLNFKEDSVSWPPKTNKQYNRGVGAKRYLAVSGWDTALASGNFLNNYAVWDGSTNSATMTWRIITPNQAGTYSLEFTADNSLTITINNISNSHSNYATIGTATRTLAANTEYVITIVATDDNSAGRGAAAVLKSPSGTTIWNTRSESYSSFISVTQTNTIYNAMLVEDNNVQLETEIFAEGITDYYHALAKAEEMVRTSRSAVNIKLQYLLKNRYFEPGDIVKIQSNTLNLGVVEDFFIKVSEVKLLEGMTCELSGTRFDYTQLAWSTKPTQAIVAPNLYNFAITAPASLTFTPSNNIISNSPGTLTWPASPEPSISGYILYFHKFQDLDADGRPNFTEIGRATQSPFSVPNLGSVVGVFGVKAFTNTITSTLTVTSTTTVSQVDIALLPPTPTNVVAIVTGDFSQAVQVSWSRPATRSNSIPYEDHSFTRVYRAKAGANPVFVEIGTSTTNTFLDSSIEYGSLLYRVKFVTSRKLEGAVSASASVNLDQNNAISSDTAIVYAYKRATSLPIDNPGECTYNFANRTISAPATLANNWVRTIPVGNDALYITSAIAYNAAATDTILAGDWATPALLASNAFSAFLISESDTVAATATGTVATLPSGNFIRLYNGSILLTSGVSYSGTATTNGLTCNVNSTTGAITLTQSNWNSDSTQFTITATYNSIAYNKVYTISKARAGTPGIDGDTVVAELTNDFHSIPTDNAGNNPVFTGASTILNVYLNGILQSSGFTYYVSDLSNINYRDNDDSVNRTGIGETNGSITSFPVSIVAISADSGYIDITAKRTSTNALFTKRFSLSKNKAGIQGTSGTNATIYYIVSSASAVSKDSANSSTPGLHTPDSLTFTPYKVVGNNNPVIATDVFFTSWTSAGTEPLTATAVTGATSVPLSDSAGLNSVNYRIYKESNKATLLDSESVPIVFKGAQGASGINAKTVALTTGQQAFSYDSAGTTPSPANTTITATAQNIVGTPYYDFLIDSISQQNTTSNTFTYNAKANISDMPDVIRVNVRENATTGTIVSSDTLSVFGVRPGLNGENAITGFLTNEAFVVATNSDGSGGSYTNAGGTFKVFNGTTDVTSSSSFFVISGSSFVSITSAGVYTVINPNQDSANATLRATYNSISIDKVYSIAKSKQGTAGQKGDTGNTGLTGPTGPDGPQGPPGIRGTLTVSRAISGNSWIDSEANTAISSAGGDSPIRGDVVTLYNSSQSFSETRIRSSGGTWTVLTAFFGGNVIVDDTITTSKLKAKSITTDKLLVTGKGAALNDDPSVTDLTAWRASSGSFTLNTVADPVVGNSVLRGTDGAHVFSRIFPVDPNKRYRIRCWARKSATGGTGAFYLRAYWYNAASNYLSVTEAANNGGTLTTAWSKRETTNVITPPFNAAFAEIAIILNYTGGALGYHEVQDVRLEEMAGADLIVDGAITAIKLAADSVTSDKIQASSITTGKLLVTGRGNALNDDPFTSDASAWPSTGLWAPAWSIVTISDGPAGTKAIRSNSGVSAAYAGSKQISFNPRKSYRIRCKARSVNANGVFYLVVDLRDVNNNVISADGTAWFYPISGILVPSAWTDYEGVFGFNTARVFPANAKTMSVGVLMNNGGNAGYHEVQDLRIEERIDTSLVVDGALTAEKVEAGLFQGNNVLTRGLTVRDDSGNIILSAGSPLNWSRVSNQPSNIYNTNITIDTNGNIQGINDTQGNNSSIANNIDRRITMPSGGTFTTTTEDFSGAIRIRLPAKINTDYPMVKFTVEIYEYIAGYSTTLSISGYLGGTSWYNVSATLIAGNVEYPVRFGHNGTYFVVWIGNTNETWKYPQIFVKDILVGYYATQASLWSKDWVIDFSSSITNQTQQVLDTYPAADWSKTARRPTNLQNLTGSEIINNGAISLTVNNNGTVLASGGPFVAGQVTSLGLGITGLTLLNESNCTIVGDTVTKTSGTNTWDAGARSRERYYACSASITCHPTQTSNYIMFGLSSNPVSPSYGDIDYAIYLDGGTVRIYELGNLVNSSISTYTANDVFTVTYDGEYVTYSKNGSILAQRIEIRRALFSFDCSLAYLNDKITGIRFVPITNSRKLQLVDSRSWNLNSNSSDADFIQKHREFIPIGTSAGGSDYIATGITPDGTNGNIWRARSGNANQTSGEGGWNGTDFPIDHTKTYRFSVWIKAFKQSPASTISGSFYLGAGGGSVKYIGLSPTYNFENNFENFTNSSNISISYIQYYSSTALRITSTAAETYIQTPTLADMPGVQNGLIKVKIRRISGSGWNGKVQYSTKTRNSFTNTYSVSFPNTTSTSEWTVISIPMANALNDEYRNSQITGLRFFFGNAGDVFDIDWITFTIDNPYMVYGQRVTIPENEWCLVVGYIHPSTYLGSQLSLSGVYRGKDGVKLPNSNFFIQDYVWPIEQQTSSLRTYQFYTTSSGNFQDFWGPRVDLLDGSEPTIAELLAIGAISGRNKVTTDNVGVFIDSAAIGSLDILTTGKIRSGKVYYGNTGGNVQTGWLIEYNNGTPRLDIGDATKYLRWTGSNLELGGQIVTNANLAGSISQDKLSLGTIGITVSPTELNVNPGTSAKTNYPTIFVTSVSGGTAPYKYAWSLSQGLATNSSCYMYISAIGSDGTTCTPGGSQPINTENNGVLICTVTDANGRTGTVSIYISSIYGTVQQ